MESALADQVVLTRFNIELIGRQSRGVDPAWLAERLALFEFACAPSVRAQQGGPRQWLIFIDSRTPQPARQRIVAAGLPGQISLLPVDGPLDLQRLQQFVADAVPVRHPYLISTRLDNDDALAIDHLDIVLAAARPGAAEFLNPLRGFQLANRRLYATQDPTSPFLSLVEPRDPARPPATTFCAPHRSARSSYPVRQLSGSVMWLQVVHGANLMNSISGVRVDADRLAARFPHVGHAFRAGESHDLMYRVDQLSSLGRAGLTRSRHGVLRLIESVRSRAPGDQ